MKCSKCSYENAVDANLCAGCGAKLEKSASGVRRISDNEISIRLAEGVEIDFVRVPAGEFLMGSDPAKDSKALPNEQPQHKLFLDEFWMGKYPVTNRQYAAYVKAEGVEPPEPWEVGQALKDKDEHPVVNVSWHAARDFCRWASEVSRKTIRLPGEAEWEKAARGTDGRTYPWGKQETDGERFNYDQQVFDTTPVGRYSPQGDSPYGCADMAGNVWEWTRSLWGRDEGTPEYGYPYQAEDGREDEDAAGAVLRTLRGGSWFYDEFNCRSTHRIRGTPGVCDDDIGFRCVSCEAFP
jgi:formylglycine-generating enzyme required for sulfatase activity